MKTILPLILLLGGLAIAAIVWYGNKQTSTQSDDARLMEAILDQQDQARQDADRASRLMAQILPAPATCEGLMTQAVFSLCEMEPDIGNDWPDWKDAASSGEQACLLDAFHQTNAHAYEIRGETYDGADPDNNRMGRFVSDLCTASLWTDGIDYGDGDKSLSDLIAGYYADRATSRVKPAQSY